MQHITKNTSGSVVRASFSQAGLSTLQSWLASLRPEPDACKQQTQLLKKMMAPLSDMQCQCTVMFDKMDIS